MVPFDVRYGFLFVCYSNFVPKMHQFLEIFDLKLYSDLETRVRGHSHHSRSSKPTRIARTVFEINGDFSRKSHISPPRVFCTPADGVSLGIGYRRTESKKLE